MTDFRYVLEGQTVEAFQMTEATRYQEKNWPEWMNSRYLLTYDHGEQRLNINDVETKIPKFGWILKYPDGSITAVGYEVMETAAKVVQDVVVKHPRADDGLTDEKLAQIHGIELAPDHSEPVVEVTGQIRNAELGQTVMSEEQSLQMAVNDEKLLDELKAAYNISLGCDPIETVTFLRGILSGRVTWCSCPPGQCDGAWDQWGCRQNSPLAK